MRSLTNKTANIKHKNLSVYKTAEKLKKRTDGFFISSFYQLFWKKKIFAVLDVWLSRSYTAL